MESIKQFIIKKNIIAFSVVVILILGLFLSVNLIRKQQVLKSKAAVDPITFSGSGVNCPAWPGACTTPSSPANLEIHLTTPYEGPIANRDVYKPDGTVTGSGCIISGTGAVDNDFPWSARLQVDFWLLQGQNPGANFAGDIYLGAAYVNNQTKTFSYDLSTSDKYITYLKGQTRIIYAVILTINSYEERGINGDLQSWNRVENMNCNK